MNNFKLASQRSFYRAFHGFNLSFNQETQEFARCILHLDGKSLRGSQDEAGMITHIVNLWDDENSILVGQEATKIGTGAGCERAAAAALLEKTDVRGDIITGDAGFSSGNFPQKIQEAGADYLLRIKNNTPTLKSTMDLRLKQCQKRHDKAQKNTLAAGQLDEREITVLPATTIHEAIFDTAFKGAKQFGVIRKISTHKATQEATGTEHFFITSLSPEEASPERLLQIHVAHWGVENNLHRTKDMLLREDCRHCRGQKKAKNIAALGSISITLLKKIHHSPARAIDKIRAKPHIFFKLFKI